MCARATDGLPNRRWARRGKGAQMIDGIVFVIVGVWFLLIGLGKARVSKNPEATAGWLKKWGIVFRIGGPIMALAGIVRIIADLARR